MKSKKEITPQQKSILNHAISYVVSHTRVEISDMMSRRRQHHYVHARQLLSYLLYRKEKLGAGLVGRLINADHATVLHSTEMIEHDEKHDSKVKEMIDNYPRAKTEQFFINIAKTEAGLYFVAYNSQKDEQYNILLEQIRLIVQQFQGTHEVIYE